jgi:hypothetical protein
LPNSVFWRWGISIVGRKSQGKQSACPGFVVDAAFAAVRWSERQQKLPWAWIGGGRDRPVIKFRQSDKQDKMAEHLIRYSAILLKNKPQIRSAFSA